MDKLDYAKALRLLRQARHTNTPELAAPLLAALRANWLAGALACGNEHGRGGASAFLSVLFQLGVFGDPPVSGSAYDAWCFLDYLQSPDHYADAPVPEAPGWLKKDNLARTVCRPARGQSGPLFSLLMPVFNPEPWHLLAAINSIRRQSYEKWELCIADDASTDPGIDKILETAGQDEPRIKIFRREVNGHISAASNSALELAVGEWTVLMDQDDLLPPFALYAVAGAVARHPEAAVIFSDEDKVEVAANAGREQFTSPFFKCGLDPDLLLAFNLVSHLGVYRTSLLRQLGGFRIGFEGSQDYDLALRMLRAFGTRSFVHIPEVLYHWRRHPGSASAGAEVKPYAKESAARARQEFVVAMGWPAAFTERGNSSFVDIRFDPPSPPPVVSLIAVGGNDADWARLYPNLETLRLSENRPTAEAVNCAAASAGGEVLVFIEEGRPANNDCMLALIGALSRSGVGIAGSRSVNAEGFLLQAGYAFASSPLPFSAAGFGVRDSGRKPDQIWLCPAYAGLHQTSGGYYSLAHLLRSVPAVYWSGMAVSRKLWNELGGFKPEMGDLAVVDFCLRAWFDKGLRSIIVPQADLVFKAIIPPRAATAEFCAAWQDQLKQGVPFQNINLDWTAGGWRLAPEAGHRRQVQPEPIYHHMKP